MIKEITFSEIQKTSENIDIILHIVVDEDFYSEGQLSKEENPIDAFGVWVTKNIETNEITFSICNEGLPVVAELTQEEIEQITKFIKQQGLDIKANFKL